MSKWEERRLGEVVKINPETLSVSKYSGNIQYIDISSVNQGTLSGYKIYDINEAPSRARRIIRPNDMIYSTVRPNLKAYYYMKDNCPQNAIASTGFAVIRSTKKSDSRFIYYLVTENSFVDYLTMVAKGSAYPAVDTNDFKRAKIKLPPISIQRKIADILSAYDDLIENNNRRIELLEKTVQYLYKEWFVRFRFPNNKRAKFENGLPQGWEVVKLGDEIDITSSKRVYLSDYVESGIPFYRSKEIIQLGNGEAITEPLYISQEKYNEFKSKYGAPQENDILITSVGTIGVSMLVDNSTFYFKDGNLTWLRSNSKPEFALYLYLWLNSSYGKQQLLSSTIGTSQSALTIENLRRNKVIKPSNDIMKSFYKIISPIILEKRNIQTQNQNLIKQRDLLLPRLMSGKIEV